MTVVENIRMVKMYDIHTSIVPAVFCIFRGNRALTISRRIPAARIILAKKLIAWTHLS